MTKKKNIVNIIAKSFSPLFSLRFNYMVEKS